MCELGVEIEGPVVDVTSVVEVPREHVNVLGNRPVNDDAGTAVDIVQDGERFIDKKSELSFERPSFSVVKKVGKIALADRRLAYVRVAKLAS